MTNNIIDQKRQGETSLMSQNNKFGLSVHDGKIVVSSRSVSERFGREHNKILRDIRELECSEEFGLSNFGQSSYTNEQNKLQPEVLMTRDGFTFLAMGFTGQKAAQFKEAYIVEFNRMEEELKSDARGQSFLAMLSDPRIAAKMLEKLADEQEHRLLLENKIAQEAHYVDYGKAVEKSDGSMLIGEFAKILTQKGFETGANRLFRQLREMGILGSKGNYYNVPNQYCMENGYFRVGYRVITHSEGSTESKPTPYLTPKGQIWLMKKLTGSKEVA